MQVIYLNVFYTSVVLILPLVLVLTLNVRLIRSLQESKRRLRHNSLQQYDGHSETNITVVMVAIVIELVLCHTPDRVLQVCTGAYPAVYTPVRRTANSIDVKKRFLRFLTFLFFLRFLK